MQKIYMDYAATSFPKPNCVTKAVVNYMSNIGTNSNRGNYGSAYDTAEVVYKTRKKLCEFFDFSLYDHVIFTANITYALNMIIKGLFKDGDHILVSAMEHNAIMRPLVQLQEKGVTFSRIPCTKEGELIVGEMESLLKKNTKAIIMTGASNVCGTCMPLKKVGDFCKKHNLIFILDSAQIAGTIPISMQEMGIDILAFTGHKGLLGPQGIGGFLISDSIAQEMEPLITGGTGSRSDSEETPDFLPDKFEAGTLNLPGIFGLYASLGYLEETGVDTIWYREKEKLKQLLTGLVEIKGVRVIGKQTVENRVAVISIQTDWIDESELSFLLDQQYGIMTRVGMHCAPNAHKTLGTFPRGTLRFSIGYRTTKEEIEFVIKAIREIREQYEKSLEQ